MNKTVVISGLFKVNVNYSSNYFISIAGLISNTMQIEKYTENDMDTKMTKKINKKFPDSLQKEHFNPLSTVKLSNKLLYKISKCMCLTYRE